MSSKKTADSPAPELELYQALVAAVPGLELKGASLSYTSLNGNMHSFLDKTGTCAVRLGKEDREAFLAAFGGGLYVHESGAVMKEYVPLSVTLLADTSAAADWLRKSFHYARGLKPKPTTKAGKTAA